MKLIGGTVGGRGRDTGDPRRNLNATLRLGTSVHKYTGIVKEFQVRVYPVPFCSFVMILKFLNLGSWVHYNFTSQERECRQNLKRRNSVLKQWILNLLYLENLDGNI